MSENINNSDNEKEFINQEDNLEDIKLFPVSSGEMIEPDKEELNINTLSVEIEKDEITEENESETELSEEEASPVFKELAQPKLPELPKENRARLQMQSPNRLYFYWSVKNNPFQTLNRAFNGKSGNYRLVVKLTNQTTENEEIHPVEAEGSWWFDVESNSVYQAEIGFYAPNRPFIRILFSNKIETPRKTPSPRRDYTPYFDVSADQFAQVLNRSGFRQDAVEVALAGDDLDFAETATQNAYSQLTGAKNFSFTESGEFRYALLALASGAALDALRGTVSPNLFASLQQSSANLSVDQARIVLEENFGATGEEYFEEEEEEFTSAVFGVSLINFPKIKRRKTSLRFSEPKLSPLSSFKLK